MSKYLQHWQIGLGIIVGSVVLGRAVYRAFSKILRAFPSRSKFEPAGEFERDTCYRRYQTAFPGSGR
ncbi:MAG: hypothetical protein GY802_16405 [Gammaproteobacteria bacterium]|nr:hypothetical protein [Gammaproteobacteria bacterium]